MCPGELPDGGGVAMVSTSVRPRERSEQGARGCSSDGNMRQKKSGERSPAGREEKEESSTYPFRITGSPFASPFSTLKIRIVLSDEQVASRLP